MAKKFNQWGLYSVKSSQLVAIDKDKVGILKSKLEPMTTSENRVFRQSEGATGHKPFDPGSKKKTSFRIVDPKTGEEAFRDVYVTENFITLEIDQIGDGSDLVETVLKKGFWVVDDVTGEAKLYKVVVRSASAQRTDKALCTCLDWKKVRMDCTYGSPAFADETTPVVIAKMESRPGLGTTTSHEIVGDFSYAVVNDAYGDVFYDGVELDVNTKRMVSKSQFEATNLTDGEGVMTIVRAAFYAMHMDMIRINDYLKIKKAWIHGMTLPEMMRDPKLGKIMDRIPMVWQIRFAGAKGILVVWDYRGKQIIDRKGAILNAEDYDVLFTEGMWKFDFDPNYPLKPNMEIVSYIKKPRGAGYLNYQFIQGLNLDSKTLISLAESALSYLEHDMLKDPAKAMKFLGLIDTQGCDAEVNENGDTMFEEMADRSKVTRAILANPDALFDKYIQQKIRKLCENFIHDMHNGRIPVPGSAFRFVVRDPHIMFGKPVLAKGQAYFNGQAGKFASFRSPLVDRSEAVVMDVVTNEAFLHLKNCVVINCYDDWAARQGGMDFDGDKVFVTDDKRIVEAIPGGKIVFGEGSKSNPPKFPLTQENIARFNLAGLGQNMIGTLTNIATIITDKMNCGKIDFQAGSEMVALLRVLQGMAIDSPKTGDRVSLEEYPQFEEPRKSQPHWMRHTSGKVEVYHSTSPLGQLHDFILGEDSTGTKSGFLHDFLNGWKTQGGDMRLDIVEVMDLVEVQQIKPLVMQLEKSYCAEYGALKSEELALFKELKEKGKGSLLTVEKIEARIKEKSAMIANKYAKLCASINADPRSVAAAAYLVSYAKDNDSVSFPWVAEPEGTIALLQEMGKKTAFKLMPVRGEFEDDVTEISVVNKKVESHDTTIKVEDGVYPLIKIDDRYFAKVAWQRPAKPTQEMLDKRIEFLLKGSTNYYNISESDALLQLVQNKGVAEIRKQKQNGINRLVLSINGVAVAATIFSAKDYDEFAVANYADKLISVNLDSLKAQITNKKLKVRGLFKLDAVITGCILPLQTCVDDMVNRSAWYWQAEKIAKEELGFDDVKVNFHPIQQDKIGDISVSFRGQKYNFAIHIGGERVVSIRGMKMSDKAFMFMHQTASESLGEVLRNA